MANLLKQATAKTIEFGPFLNSTDGDTEEPGLSLVAADILVSKDHATLTAKSDTTNPTGGSNAHYQVTLNGTDTGTLGKLRVWCHKSGTLAVWEDFIVVTANVYQAFAVVGTERLQVNVIQLNSGVQSLNDLKDFADDGYDPSTNKVQGVVLCDAVTALTGHTAQTGDNYDRLGAPTGASVSADVAVVNSIVDAILADTTVIVADDIPGLIAALNNLSAAQVNAEIADVIDTNTSGEPAQGAPPVTASLRTKIDWLYKFGRNKKEQTASLWSLYNDAGDTVDSKATVSDNGTTATKEEIVTGP